MNPEIRRQVQKFWTSGFHSYRSRKSGKFCSCSRNSGIGVPENLENSVPVPEILESVVAFKQKFGDRSRNSGPKCLHSYRSRKSGKFCSNSRNSGIEGYVNPEIRRQVQKFWTKVFALIPKICIRGFRIPENLENSVPVPEILESVVAFKQKFGDRSRNSGLCVVKHTNILFTCK